jgi:hypothetical protein
VERIGDTQNQFQSSTLTVPAAKIDPVVSREDLDYEAGFGGQEGLEDRYATTYGAH